MGKNMLNTGGVNVNATHSHQSRAHALDEIHHEDEIEEEKSSERKQAEEVLAQYFDVITGRVANPSSPSSVASTASTSTRPSPANFSLATQYIPARERDLTSDEMNNASHILSSVEGRAAFASVLNRQRNTHGGLKLSSAALKRLAAFALLFLDQAFKTIHVTPTQLSMILAQSFFTEEETITDSKETDVNEASAQKRTYLLQLIKHHPVSHSLRLLHLVLLLLLQLSGLHKRFVYL
jgi:hypothetical protein